MTHNAKALEAMKAEMDKALAKATVGCFSSVDVCDDAVGCMCQTLIDEAARNGLTAYLASLEEQGLRRKGHCYEMQDGNDTGVWIAASNDRFALMSSFPVHIEKDET